jgi:hypothetical protein
MANCDATTPKCNEAPHLARFLLFDVLQRVEIGNFAGNAGAESGRVELLDEANAAPAVFHAVPSFPGANTQRGHKSDPSDNNST